MADTPWLKVKIIFIVVTLGLAIGGAGLAGLGEYGSVEQSAKAVRSQTPPIVKDIASEKQKLPVLTDLYDDPLPNGAVARLGTLRLRPGGLSYGAAFSPDGKLLVSTGSASEGLCVWDLATGRLMRRHPVGRSSFFVAFAPDGKSVLTAGFDLIDIETGKVIRRLDGPGFDCWQAAFSPDGKIAAAGERHNSGGPHKVVLWEVATGKVLHTLDGHRTTVNNVAFSPDGTILASGSEKARLWDVASGRELRQFDGHGPVGFAPGGKILASAIKDGTGLWNLDTGKLIDQLISEQASEGSVMTITFSPDGKKLARLGHEGLIRLWDTESKQEIRRWRTGDDGLLSGCFSPDGAVIVSVSNGAIRRWETATGKELEPSTAHRGTVNVLSFAANGKTLFSSGWDRKIVEWDVAANKGLFRSLNESRWSAGKGTGSGRNGLSPDGRIAAHAYELENVLRLWDTVTGKSIQTFTVNHLESVSISTDSKLVAACDRDGVRTWQIGSGKQVHHLPGGSALAFSPTSTVLACAGPDTRITLWDLATGNEMRSWDSQNMQSRLVFSPDGKLLATASFGNVRIWAVESGKEIHRFETRGAVYGLAFSPTGRILACGGGNKQPSPKGVVDMTSTVQMWEVYSGQEIRKFEGQQGLVWSLAFSPDSRMLASGGSDSTILLWDLAGVATIGNLKSAILAAKEMEGLWSDLASDAAKADRAIWTLANAPGQTVSLLKERLYFVPAPAEKIANLLVELDSDQFSIRQKAAKALDGWGDAAEASVRKTLQGTPPLEVRQRLEQFVTKQDKAAIRKLRAIETLEHIGSPEARQLLEALSTAAPNPRVGQAAAAALERLGKMIK